MEKSYSSVFENARRIIFEARECAVKYGRSENSVRLMAVTKTVPPNAVNEAIAAGVTLLGENKAQELLSKYQAYEKDGVGIHFIGHLQSNKVRQIIDKVTMIQSVGSVSLANEIDKQALKNNITMDVLVEVNIGGEDTKSGILPRELPELLSVISNLHGISVKGLMTIPPYCDDIKQTENYFFDMQKLFIDIRGKNIDNVSMDILSMGMSGDYKEAIKHGANIIRVGTGVFGARFYTQ